MHSERSIFLLALSLHVIFSSAFPVQSSESTDDLPPNVRRQQSQEFEPPRLVPGVRSEDVNSFGFVTATLATSSLQSTPAVDTLLRTKTVVSVSTAISTVTTTVTQTPISTTAASETSSSSSTSTASIQERATSISLATASSSPPSSSSSSPSKGTIVAISFACIAAVALSIFAAYTVWRQRRNDIRRSSPPPSRRSRNYKTGHPPRPQHSSKTAARDPPTSNMQIPELVIPEMAEISRHPSRGTESNPFLTADERLECAGADTDVFYGQAHAEPLQAARPTVAFAPAVMTRNISVTPPASSEYSDGLDVPGLGGSPRRHRESNGSDVSDVSLASDVTNLTTMSLLISNSSRSATPPRTPSPVQPRSILKRNKNYAEFEDVETGKSADEGYIKMTRSRYSLTGFLQRIALRNSAPVEKSQERVYPELAYLYDPPLPTASTTSNLGIQPRAQASTPAPQPPNPIETNPNRNNNSKPNRYPDSWSQSPPITTSAAATPTTNTTTPSPPTPKPATTRPILHLQTPSLFPFPAISHFLPGNGPSPFPTSYLPRQMETRHTYSHPQSQTPVWWSEADGARMNAQNTSYERGAVAGMMTTRHDRDDDDDGEGEETPLVSPPPPPVPPKHPMRMKEMGLSLGVRGGEDEAETDDEDQDQDQDVVGDVECQVKTRPRRGSRFEEVGLIP